MAGLQHVIMRSLIVIKTAVSEHTKLLETILKLVDQLVSKSNSFGELRDPETEDISCSFPMTSFEAFQHVEQQLQNKDFLTKFVSLIDRFH